MYNIVVQESSEYSQITYGENEPHNTYSHKTSGRQAALSLSHRDDRNTRQDTKYYTMTPLFQANNKAMAIHKTSTNNGRND